MSLINQMLKDLDARHEGDARSRLHREVRALPAAPERSSLRIVLIALLLAVLTAAAAWVYLRPGAESATTSSAPAVAVVTPPAVAAAPAIAAEAVSGSAVATAEPATPSAQLTTSALQPPMPVVDDSSGMKLSAALDRLPTTEPAEKRAAGPASSRRETASAKPAVTVATPENSASQTPAPAPQPSPASRESASVAAAKAVSSAPAVAPGVIEKRPPAQQTGREKAEADYRRALTLVNGARVQEATDLLLDALRHDGGHVAARQLLSRLLIEQRRLDEAMAILAEGLAAQPGQVGWAMSLARLQVERNDLPGAARTLQIAQPYATGNGDYQGFAGHIQYRLGNPAAAISFYRAAASVAPADGRWWLGLGLSLEAMQQSAEARDAFQRARATGSLSGDLATLVDQKLR